MNLKDIGDIELIDKYEKARSFGMPIPLAIFISLLSFYIAYQINATLFFLMCGIHLGLIIFDDKSYDTKIYKNEMKSRKLI